LRAQWILRGHIGKKGKKGAGNDGQVGSITRHTAHREEKEDYSFSYTFASAGKREKKGKGEESN